MHPGSIRRHRIGTDEYFQHQVLMLAISHAHELVTDPSDDQSVMKLKAKATEFLNQPDQFKERLGLSVAALLDAADTDAYYDEDIDDNTLRVLIDDVFEALAGV